MNVLIASCVPRQREGGVAAVIYGVGEHLERFGHSVTYAFREDLIRGQIKHSRIETFLFAVRVARIILDAPEKYDVVNLHAPIGWVYGLLRKSKMRRRCPPYVMLMHGLEERYRIEMKREARRGRAWHFRLANRIWHSLYHMTFYWLCIRTADESIVLNREAKSCLELKYKCSGRRVWLVPNGVTEQMFITRYYSARGPLRLLFVGSWIDRKGIYYLADSLSALVRRFPEIELTIAGCASQPEEVKAYFDAAARGHVRVLPFIKAERMPEIYGGHDVFVFPSLVEGMPLALLEAMASGMPVVTTDSCGMADIVQDGINGLLVPPADAPAIVAAVSRLYRCPELRRSLGQAAQLTMRRYTWEKVARRFEGIFLNVAHLPKRTTDSAALEAGA